MIKIREPCNPNWTVCNRKFKQYNHFHNSKNIHFASDNTAQHSKLLSKEKLLSQMPIKETTNRLIASKLLYCCIDCSVKILKNTQETTRTPHKYLICRYIQMVRNVLFLSKLTHTITSAKFPVRKRKKGNLVKLFYWFCGVATFSLKYIWIFTSCFILYQV